MNKKHKNIKLDELIHDNSDRYAGHMVQDHFPSQIDGLKTVHRRIIYALKDINDVIGSTGLVSKVLSYHNKGDTALYDAITSVARPFVVAPTFVVIEGKVGSYNEPIAAAPRYTSGKLSDYVKDMFINDISMDSIPKKTNENFDGTEPVYFIPKIPMTLVLASTNIGYGYTSRGISFSFKDVCDLTIAHISDKKNGIESMYDTLVPYIYGCHILNFQEIRKKYNGKQLPGDIRILQESEYKILDSNSIAIYTIADNGTPSTMYDSILKEIKTKGTWFNQHVKDLNNYTDKKSHNTVEIVLTIRNTTNVFTALDKIRKYIASSYTVYNNYELNSKMRVSTIRTLMENWYEERLRSASVTITKKLTNYKSNIVRYTTMLRIVDDVDTVVDILKSSDDREMANDMLRDKFTLTPYQADIIINTPLSVLIKVSKNDLLSKLDKVKSDYKKWSNILHEGMDAYLINTVQELRDKYTNYRYYGFSFESLKRYEGILICNNGYILIENKPELMYYLSKHSKRLQIIRYVQFDISNVNRYIDIKLYAPHIKGSKRLVPTDTVSHKISNSPTIMLDDTYTHTCTMMNKSNTCNVERGITSISDNTIYVKSNVSYLDMNGGIHDIELSDVDKDTIRRCKGIWNTISDEDKSNAVLYFMDGNRVSIIKYPKTGKIRFNIKQLEYIGMTTENMSFIKIINGKSYEFMTNDKVVKELSEYDKSSVQLSVFKMRLR